MDWVTGIRWPGRGEEEHTAPVSITQAEQRERRRERGRETEEERERGRERERDREGGRLGDRAKLMKQHTHTQSRIYSRLKNHTTHMN